MPVYVDMLLFDREKWKRLIFGEIRANLSAYVQMGGDEAIGKAAALGVIASFDVTNPKVTEWLQDYAFHRISDINDTSAARYRAILTPALENGESYMDIAKRIREDPVVGETASQYRAEMIARTESAYAQINGQVLGVREANQNAIDAGVPPPFAGRVFRANPDCCDICNELDGTPIPMDADVDLPHPNCRCSEAMEISSAYSGE